MKNLVKVFLPAIIGLSMIINAQAADYHWVGGSGNWSDFASHWATSPGGSSFHTQVPTSVDNVFFDGNSFSATGQTVTLDTTIVYCKDMDWTGAIGGSILASANSTIELKVFGSFTLNPTMVFSFNGKLTFTALAPGKTLTTFAQTLPCEIEFNGAGGEWVMQDSFATTKKITLTYGTLRTNNYKFACSQFWSTNNNFRALYLGTSTVEITQGTSSRWSVHKSLTLDADSSVILIGNGNSLNFSSELHSYNIIICNSFSYSNQLNADSLTIKKIISYGGTLQLDCWGTVIDTMIIGGSLEVRFPNHNNYYKYIQVNYDVMFGFISGGNQSDTIEKLIVGRHVNFEYSAGDTYVRNIMVHGNLVIESHTSSPNSNQTFDTCTIYGNGSFLSDNNDLGVLTITQGKTFTFGANKTQIIDSLIPLSSPGFPIQLVSSDLGLTANVTINSPLCADYLYIHGLHAAGDSSLYAGANSNDVANNAGWLFSSCTSVACNIAGNNAICATDSTSFTASGGVSYAWSGPNGFSSTTASTGSINVAGIYTVSVTDGSGNTGSCSRNLVVNALPVCMISGDTTVCGSEVTSFTASGGSSFLWSGPNGFTKTTASTGSINLAGTYSVTVTGSGSCTSSCSQILTAYPSPACSIAGTNVVCANTTTSFTASGGVSYAWTGPGGFSATTANSGAVGTAGNYSVTVTDVNGCTSACSVNLIVTNISVSATATGITCAGCNDGTAAATVAGTTAPVTYTWNTSPIQSTQTATGLPPGTYTVCVSDANGCSACASVFVDSINCTGFSVTAQASTASCGTCNDGTAYAMISGGSPPFNFTWLTNPIQTNDTATGLLPGAYVVCVVDANGCNSCDTVIVTTGNCSAFFDLYPDTLPHQYYAVNRSSGNTPLSLAWNWGDGTSDTTAFPSHTYAAPGLYTICLSITDSVGCTDTYCNPYYLLKDGNAMIQVNVIDPLATGIAPNVEDADITLYPNPASNFVTVSFSIPVTQGEIKLFDLSGALKSTDLINGQQVRLSTKDLTSGIYFLEVTANQTTVRKKFLKL